MKSIVVKLKEYPQHIQGYGLLYPPSTRMIMDKICESMPNGFRYIDHIIETEFTEDISLEKYVPRADTSLKIPRGTLTYNIRIYIEER